MLYIMYLQYYDIVVIYKYRPRVQISVNKFCHI
jgi:hypothetical protein